MNQSEKKNLTCKQIPRLVWGICVSLVCVVVFSCFYGTFRNMAIPYKTSPMESNSNMSWLYQNSYLLYGDLYNTINQSTLDYFDIYVTAEEEYQWLLDERQLDNYIFRMQEAENTDLVVEEKDNISLEEANYLLSDYDTVKAYFMHLSDSFSHFNSIYDYSIIDHETGTCLTNMSAEDIPREDTQYFQVSFRFDNVGNATIGNDVVAQNESNIRKLANEISRRYNYQSEPEVNISVLKKYADIGRPKNCTVTYSISVENWENMTSCFEVHSNGNGSFSCYKVADTLSEYAAYTSAGMYGILSMVFIGMILLGFVFPIPRKVVNTRLCEKCSGICIEAILCLMFVWFVFGIEYTMRWIVTVAEQSLAIRLREQLNSSGTFSRLLVYCINLLVMTFVFFGCWYFGNCLRPMRKQGLREYLKQRSKFLSIFPYFKKKLNKMYHWLRHLDLTKNAHKVILKIVVINAILFIISNLLWVGGWPLTILYSVILYFVLRKYISDIQNDYSLLLKATNEIAQGNLNTVMDEDLGMFEPFKPQIIKIQSGFRKAVEEEVKSQRMKSELITNVSHDLKTPLTAIITYIHLLQDIKISEQQRAEYLETLEQKSLRLKVLIEDLFEVSKANSHNVTLNIMDVDVMNLVKQVSFEMADKINAANLDVRLNLPSGKIAIPLDSQKTYRIYENLFGNIAKYALPGTRVYVSGVYTDDSAIITLKNITSEEITVDAEELTDRFVRNDSARNTEGSGLGLAIAKSFTEIQGGKLNIEVDGDLFKVTTIWQLKKNQ